MPIKILVASVHVVTSIYISFEKNVRAKYSLHVVFLVVFQHLLDIQQQLMMLLCLMRVQHFKTKLSFIGMVEDGAFEDSSPIGYYQGQKTLGLKFISGTKIYQKNSFAVN